MHGCPSNYRAAARWQPRYQSLTLWLEALEATPPPQMRCCCCCHHSHHAAAAAAAAMPSQPHNKRNHYHLGSFSNCQLRSQCRHSQGRLGGVDATQDAPQQHTGTTRKPVTQVPNTLNAGPAVSLLLPHCHCHHRRLRCCRRCCAITPSLLHFKTQHSIIYSRGDLEAYMPRRMS